MADYSDYVLDDYGRPILGAKVTLFSENGQILIDTATTDSLGQFTVTGPDAKSVLVVSYGGLNERSLIIVGNPPEYVGPVGPSNNTRVNLASLKAAATTDLTSLYDGSLWTWMLGDYTSLSAAYPSGYVKADSTPIATGAWVRQKSSKVNYDGRTVEDKFGEFPSVRDTRFAGGAKGDGVTNDTAALQAAMNALTFGNIRGLFFPPGTYCISDTITAPIALSSFQFVGSSGYDGVRGPINFGLATSLKWIGAADAAKAMVKFNQSSGVVWRGISLNCDGKAGYGLQFMSSDSATGGVKCVVENCSVHYAYGTISGGVTTGGDGIIVGENGVPGAPPAGRQFFGNVFRNLTFYGCKRSAIHINEWNADQQLFDTVMVYFDDRTSPVACDYGIWFDHGGQWSKIDNLQTGGLSVTGSRLGTGYSVFNKGSDNGISGAFGLTLTNVWQEGEGGLYYGVTSTNDNKGFSFVQCASFTSNTANPSVYIDKGTSDPIIYNFLGCTFLSDLKVGTAAFTKSELNLTGIAFAAGRGLVDASNRRTANGVFVMGNTVGGVITVPRFVDTYIATLASNIATVYAEGVGKPGDQITLILTQDGTGSRTITWSGGSIATMPLPPQPGTAAGAKTVYTFTSDGTAYYLTSAVGNA